jgi:drug/metabolite transporter (DMT)-like permease
MTATTMRTARVRNERGLTRLVLPVVFVLIWSSGFLVGSIGSRASGTPLALVAWRLLLALAVLAPIALVTRAPWPRQPRVWGHLLLIGALLQTVQLGAVYLGLSQGVSAGLSSLVLSTAPLVVAAVAVPMFAERLSGRQCAGLLLGLVGVGVSLSGDLTGGSRQQLAGYGFTGLALLGFAAGTLYQKKVGLDVDLRAGTTIQLIGGAVTSVPLALLHGGLGLPVTGPVVFSIIWLALVSSIGGFSLLFVLLRSRSGGAATSLLYLVPPVTAVLGVPLLGQRISAGVFVGMAVSAVGVLLVLFAGRPRPAPAWRVEVAIPARTTRATPGS